MTDIEKLREKILTILSDEIGASHYEFCGAVVEGRPEAAEKLIALFQEWKRREE